MSNADLRLGNFQWNEGIKPLGNGENFQQRMDP